MSYIQSLEQPLSIPLLIKTILQHTPQRDDFESHKAYSPSLQQHTPQARITLTLQDFTNTYKGLSKYNYRKLSKNRKHLELQNQKPYDQFLHQSKALTTILLNFEKHLSKTNL